MQEARSWKSIKKICDKIKSKLPSSVQTKLKNINKAGTCPICTTKRVSQTSRIILDYLHVIKNNLTLDQLQTHVNGVVVDIPFRQYERIRDTDKSVLSHLDQYLLDHIGGMSTQRVVSIITLVKDNGSSGSSLQRIDLERLKKEIEVRNWKPVYDIKEIDGVKVKHKNKGNMNWGGHYFYNVSGGSKKSFKSHKLQPQIFTTSKGFMSNDGVVTDIISSLIWQLLYIHDLSIYILDEDIFKYKQLLEDYLKSKIYMGKSCLEYLNELKNIHDGKLISPITREYISIHAFDCDKTLNKDDQVNISHNDAVNNHRICWCEQQNVMLSDYRPGNLFWDTHLGNMQQQSFTIQQYWNEIEKRLGLFKLQTNQLQSKQ
jgi:hypothetical protein